VNSSHHLIGGQDKLSAFIDGARRNTFATFANLRGIYTLLEEINEAFFKFNENLLNPSDPFAAFFSLKAHSSYLGSVRLSTSGQLPEAYMVLRGCLENSLYGFYFHRKPESGKTWLRRHEDEESRRRVRDEFKAGGC